MPRRKAIAEVIAEARAAVLRDSPVPEDDGQGAPDWDEEPVVLDDRVLTANQLVAFNMQRARKSRGWDQEYMGLKLASVTGRAWSRASVSSAESSWRGGRVRKFDANEILALAVVLDLPVQSLFLPPDTDASLNAFTVDHASEVGSRLLRRDELVQRIEPVPAPAEYTDRVTREHKRSYVHWEPARYTREIPGDEEQLKAIVAQLREAGVDVTEVLRDEGNPR